MIDSHIHILPYIDDGAADNEIAIKMVNIACTDNISSMICTPHDLNTVHKNPKQKVLQSVDKMQKIIDDANLNLKIHPGAELHISPDLVSKVLEGEAITLANRNKHVLVEFPKHLVPYGSENILENLLYNNYTPVIAHPERNPTLTSRPELLQEWVNWGCKAQLTAMSVTGEFNSKLQTISRRWCHEGLIHLVASDAHRPTGRAPILSKAYQTLIKWLGQESADTLIKMNPQHIIDGAELDSLPVTHAPRLIKQRKSIFQFIRQKSW